jgi:outer membrane protein TolC
LISSIALLLAGVAAAAAGEAPARPRSGARPKPAAKIVRVVHEQTEQPPEIDAPPEDADRRPNGPSRRGAAIGDAFEGLERVLVVPEMEERLIDLPTALRLAEAQNPTIALGRQAIVEAVALRMGARALLLPSLNAGSNYHLHQGKLQTSFGEIRDVNSQSVYFGAGARTLAAETVAIPGVRIFSHLGDAYFQPLAAGQTVAARSADSIGIENSMLMTVVRRYLELALAESTLDAIHQGEDQMREIVRSTAAFAVSGEGREGDFNRARSDALLLHAHEQRAQETMAVASAELSRVLHLDPSIRLRTQPGVLEMVQLIDPSYSMPELVQIALSARPELIARSAEIAAADYRVRLESTRPLLPVISVGFSGGAFGGGSNRQDLGVPSFFMRLGGRTDFDVMAIWSLQNLGLGNSAIARQRRAERDQIISSRALFANRVGREVGDAYARSEAWRRQVEVARARLATAVTGAREEVARTRGGEGLPIEAVDSINLLAEAGQALVEAIANYNLSQFELFVAIGQTPNAALPDPTAAIGGVPQENEDDEIRVTKPE